MYVDEELSGPFAFLQLIIDYSMGSDGHLVSCNFLGLMTFDNIIFSLSFCFMKDQSWTSTKSKACSTWVEKSNKYWTRWGGMRYAYWIGLKDSYLVFIYPRAAYVILCKNLCRVMWHSLVHSMWKHVWFFVDTSSNVHQFWLN